MIHIVKKRYRQARVSLCIVLLSFNTLSSCVHTRKALGVDVPIATISYSYSPSNESVEAMEHNTTERSNRHLIKPMFCVFAAVVGTGVVTGGIWGLIWGLHEIVSYFDDGRNILK